MAVLQKIRQRSLLLILVIGFSLLAFIVQDLYRKGGLSQTSKDVGSINGKDISFEDFRVKVSNVEKSGQGMSSTQAANRVWDQEVSIALLTSEFDKLGIRVGENHIMEIFKADQNIGKNPMFLNAAGLFDLAKFKDFFKSNNSSKISYVLKGNKDKIKSLTNLLDQHEIIYGYSESKNQVKGYNYSANKEIKIDIDKNDLIVSANQPKGKLVEILFEQKTKLSDPLTYDITAWSLPYAYGLEASVIDVKVETVSKTSNFKLNEINSNSIGYIFEWSSLKDAEFLSSLLTNDFNVRYNVKEITTNGKKFNPGSIILLQRDQNKKDFHSSVIELGNLHERKTHAIISGISDNGPDLGSSDVKLLLNKKVATLAGDGISSLNYGAIWHFFEKTLKYPLTHLNYDTFNQVDLSSIDVIILASGFYTANSKYDTKIKNWVSNGGKLIAIDRALNSLSRLDIGLNKNTNGIENNISFVSDFSSRSNQESNNNYNLVKYNERNRSRINQSISGAIFKIHLDNSHPMAYGYNENHYYSLKIGNSAYSLLENGYNIGYLKQDPKPTSGFAGQEALYKISNSLVFGHQNYGRGSFIYMVDNPLFRSFWENGKLLLVNSIFFVE